MDYGDRQNRAEMLVKTFCAQGTKQFPLKGKTYTGQQIANEIECMTDLGKDLVAVAGFVIQALNSTPDFFTKNL